MPRLGMHSQRSEGEAGLAWPDRLRLAVGVAGDLEAAVGHEYQVGHYKIIETSRDVGPKVSQDIARGISQKPIGWDLLQFDKLLPPRRSCFGSHGRDTRPAVAGTPRGRLCACCRAVADSRHAGRGCAAGVSGIAGAPPRPPEVPRLRA